MDLIRRIGKKADELLDKEYDEYQEYEFKGIVLTNSRVIRISNKISIVGMAKSMVRKVRDLVNVWTM